jgi:branched-chain amino acid transport system ATP-binding protein
LTVLLEIAGLTKRFGGLVAVSGVGFAVERGAVVSVVGPNGAGKTTLFNLISGVIRPDAGTVRFDGRDVTGWQPHHLNALGIGRTFQNVRLFGHLNALENVMVGRTCRTHSNVADALLYLPRDRRDRRESLHYAEALLEWVGVGANRLRMPNELPYGDQRRVEIARALATEPKLLILDEPTAGMVAREAHAIVELMAKLTERGITLLLIEHNMNVVMAVSQRIVVLNFGQKIAEGSPAAIRGDARVIEAYLGADVEVGA